MLASLGVGRLSTDRTLTPPAVQVHSVAGVAFRRPPLHEESIAAAKLVAGAS